MPEPAFLVYCTIIGKISNKDEMDELDCMKPEKRNVLDEDLLRAVRIEIDSLQDSERLLLDHSDHILKLQEQTVARANTVITRKNDLMDKIDSLLCKFSVQEHNSLSTLAGREINPVQPSLPQVAQTAPNPVLVDAQTQTDFEFEAELQKAAKCVAAYTMVNCANNIMHQKIMEQESKLAEEKENRFKQEEIFKEKISTLECENQLLEGELDKFRLQVVHMQAEIQRLQSSELPESSIP
ncbi:hypothetical protein DSO57_1001926 [Entomophthora muscae]|uniref:Uncharacterized protein n=1 Tax=Entomophthora muscae TaxID=34485 RepID=A0ACC2UIA0_9FUNG|nr:hypothetical protein DSO57_1001926 [Entomophthora muscae]